MCYRNYHDARRHAIRTAEIQRQYCFSPSIILLYIDPDMVFRNRSVRRKDSHLCMCVCVCACVRACVRACVCVCMGVETHTGKRNESV